MPEQFKRRRIIFALNNWRGWCGAAIQYAAAVNDDANAFLYFCNDMEEIVRKKGVLIRVLNYCVNLMGDCGLTTADIDGDCLGIIVLYGKSSKLPRNLLEDANIMSRVKALAHFSEGAPNTFQYLDANLSSDLKHIALQFFTIDNGETFSKLVSHWILTGYFNLT